MELPIVGLLLIDQKVMGLNLARSKGIFSEQKKMLRVSVGTPKCGASNNHRT